MPRTISPVLTHIADSSATIKYPADFWTRDRKRIQALRFLFCTEEFSEYLQVVKASERHTPSHQPDRSLFGESGQNNNPFCLPTTYRLCQLQALNGVNRILTLQKSNSTPQRSSQPQVRICHRCCRRSDDGIVYVLAAYSGPMRHSESRLSADALSCSAGLSGRPNPPSSQKLWGCVDRHGRREQPPSQTRRPSESRLTASHRESSFQLIISATVGTRGPISGGAQALAAGQKNHGPLTRLSR